MQYIQLQKYKSDQDYGKEAEFDGTYLLNHRIYLKVHYLKSSKKHTPSKWLKFTGKVQNQEGSS